MKYIFLFLILFSRFIGATPLIKMETNMGTIILELDEDRAPATVANFLRYVQKDFYRQTLIHRVIPNFVIQGGGYDLNLKEKNTENPIANEAHNGLKNLKYTIAMARTDNPHSATSQFFINLNDNLPLDAGQHDKYGYAVFGKVIQGFEVVDKIGKVATNELDIPLNPIEILTIEKIEKDTK